MPSSFPREVCTRGYIIRTFRLTDTSLIVDWLTEHKGRISTIARGAFRKKSAFAGKLDWLFYAEISYQRSRSSNLHALKEVELQATPSQIRRSVPSLNQIAYFVELIRRATETETPIPDIFQLFHQAVRQAEQGVLGATFILWFEWRLLDILGLHPAMNDGRLNEDCRQILTLWSRSPEEFPHEQTIHPPQIARLGSLFARHWIAEIGRCPSLRNRLLQ